MTKWSVKRALRRTKSRVADAQAALFDIASVWAGVDQGTVNEAEEWARSLETWMADVEEMIAERQAAGEEIGP
ncbi:hypothetical protein [Pleomorphomonas koreensis]|uniref:hypothetical protein n=1 Tax=Pleomorphomonas koreensis TaxID=257440 RepID=UPI0012EB71DD|nr:hypothetical protein [Pleomorphomonas koreensis]